MNEVFNWEGLVRHAARIHDHEAAIRWWRMSQRYGPALPAERAKEIWEEFNHE